VVVVVVEEAAVQLFLKLQFLESSPPPPPIAIDRSLALPFPALQDHLHAREQLTILSESFPPLPSVAILPRPPPFDYPPLLVQIEPHLSVVAVVPDFLLFHRC